jgi:lipopolysaccharide export system permease protein
LRLEKGERQEDMPATGQQVHTYPFLRMSFSSFTTMYDMQEFDATKTDEKLFSKHYSLLSTHQLIKALDSLDQQLYRVSEDLQRSSDNFYHFRRKLYTDSSLLASQGKNYFWVEGQPTPQGEKNVSIWEGTPAEKRDYLKTRAMNSLRTLRDQAVNMQSSIKRYRQSAAEHENEIHQKFLYAIACLLFLVIGAPMGAIIRKGGFGYPILVAFIFFMVFFVLNLSGEQLVKGLTVSPWLGGWLPAIVLFPLALVLLQKAKNDEHLLDFSTWTRQWQRWKGRWLKKS